MQINVNKTFLLVTYKNKKRREQEPAPLLTISGENLQAMDLNDVCRYLEYWSTLCTKGLQYPTGKDI